MNFKLHYGPRIDRLRINGRDIPPAEVHRIFRYRRPTYNRIEEAAKWSFVNDDPLFMGKYFRPGENRIEVVVTAGKSFEERPFSLYTRFVAKLPRTGSTAK